MTKQRFDELYNEHYEIIKMVNKLHDFTLSYNSTICLEKLLINLRDEYLTKLASEFNCSIKYFYDDISIE